MTTLEHKQEMDNIKGWLLSGAITYEQAERMAKTHLQAMNEKGAEIAKRHGMKYRKITFSGFMR